MVDAPLCSPEVLIVLSLAIASRNQCIAFIFLVFRISESLYMYFRNNSQQFSNLLGLSQR